MCLYVCIVAFKGILTDDEYNCILHTVIAIIVLETDYLLKDSEMIVLAEDWIVKSIELGKKTFGDSFMTIKSHMMIHMPKIVQHQAAPMTQNSAYEFESWNSEIRIN